VCIHTEKEGVNCGNNIMGKTELLEIIKKLLKMETDLDFLLNLPESDLETLIVCIRERVD
jgi:predicted ATP-binding protein involved in virulence